MKRLWLLLLLALVFLIYILAKATPRSPNLVIVVLDAMRADHVGCYGYPRDTTPNIDRIAEGACVFRSHYTPVPFTLPSTVSLFSGQYPDTHGLFYPGPGRAEPEENLATLMNKVGFATALFSSTPCASPAMGAGAAFTDAYYRTEFPGMSAEAALKAVDGWLDEHADSPFCAYIHLLPPHEPYETPAEFVRMFKGKVPPGYDPDAYTLWQFPWPIYPNGLPNYKEPPPMPDWPNLYDAHLRYGDWAVGRIYEMLETRRLLDNTVFIVTADHGEAFGEHGYPWHAMAIHGEATHIPLIIRIPREAPIAVTTLTQSVDVFPTLCDMFDFPIPKGVQGRSLAPLLAGETLEDGYSVAVSHRPIKYCIRDVECSLVLYEEPTWRELYADPSRERLNVLAERPEDHARLESAFAAWMQTQPKEAQAFLAGRAAPVAGEYKGLDEGVREQLRHLGYLR